MQLAKESHGTQFSLRTICVSSIGREIEIGIAKVEYSAMKNLSGDFVYSKRRKHFGLGETQQSGKAHWKTLEEA